MTNDSELSIKLVRFWPIMAEMGTQINPVGAIIWHDHEAKSTILFQSATSLKLKLPSYCAVEISPHCMLNQRFMGAIIVPNRSQINSLIFQSSPAIFWNDPG